MGRLAGLRGRAERIEPAGFLFEDTAENRESFGRWTRYLKVDNGMGLAINLVTVLAMCWLALALLRPEGLVPKDWELAVVQARFFEVSWGPIGRALFLFVAAAFLADTWLGVTDGFAHMHADWCCANFGWAGRLGLRRVYLGWVVLIAIGSLVTIPLAAPGPLLAAGGTINFLSMAVYIPVLVALNHVYLARRLPAWTRPSVAWFAYLAGTWIFYLGVSIGTGGPAGDGPRLAAAQLCGWKDRAWLTLVALAPLVPFLSKPFHIDDPVYLAVARQIREQPLRPFDFTLNWYGTPEPMWSIMLNPPGLGYLLTPLTAIFGESEVPLHAVFLLFALLAVHSAHAIARRFTTRPSRRRCFRRGADLRGSRPPSWRTFRRRSLSALALLLSAVEGRRGAATLAGVAASLAVLVKYNSVFVIPLLALAAILFDPRPLRHAVAVILPLLSLLLWEASNFQTHGASHLLNALGQVQAERLGWPR
jgi:hypothetical protein